ncbi:MAG: hypothetical protein JSW22_07410 [Chloroflexota bacterium]|nr:MAG: hypothetical protein JSW22_07410 [Chloroflexota bacterium]
MLEILEQNARATPAQIAATVGKPVREVQKIIRQAEIKVSGLIDATSVWVTHEYLFLR